MTSETPTARPAPRKRGGFVSKFALVIALVLVVALVIFFLQNMIHTTINFVGWNFDVTQGVSLLGAAVVGSLITIFVTTALRVRRAVRLP